MRVLVPRNAERLQEPAMESPSAHWMASSRIGVSCPMVASSAMAGSVLSGGGGSPATSSTAELSAPGRQAACVFVEPVSMLPPCGGSPAPT